MLEIIEAEHGPIVDGDAIAQTVGDYLIDQLANFEQRLDQRIERLATPKESIKLPADQLTDAVRGSVMYGALLLTGVSEEDAYRAAEVLIKHQKAEPEPVDPEPEPVVPDPEDPEDPEPEVGIG